MFENIKSPSGLYRKLDKVSNDGLLRHMVEAVDEKLGTHYNARYGSKATTDAITKKLDAVEQELERRGLTTDDIWETGMARVRAEQAAAKFEDQADTSFDFGANAPKEGDAFTVGMGSRKTALKPDAPSLFGGPDLFGNARTMAESDVGMGKPAPKATGAAPELPGAIPASEMAARRAELGFEPSATEKTATKGQADMFSVGQGGGRPTPITMNEPAGSLVRAPAKAVEPRYPAPGGVAGRPNVSPVGIAHSLKTIFNPRSLSPEADRTGSVIVGEAARGWQMQAQATADLHDLSRQVGKLTRAENVELWDAAEHWNEKSSRDRARALNPALPALVDHFHQVTARFTKELQSLGLLEGAIDSYIGRFWVQPRTSIGEITQRIFSRRTMEGPKSFAKKRTIPDFKTGLSVGKIPLTYNFVEGQLLKIGEMQKAIAGRRMVNTAVELGDVKKVMDMVGQEVPETLDGRKWQRIGNEHDPAFTIYGPPEVVAKEAFDAGVRDQLNAVIASFPNLTSERVRVIRDKPSAWGIAHGPRGDYMAAKYGGDNTIIMHELGHIIDFRTGLWNQIVNPAPREAHTFTKGKRVGQTVQRAERQAPELVKNRGAIKAELRVLADMRDEGQQAALDNPTRKAYRRDKMEQMANMVHAFIYSPERMQEAAPNVYGALKTVIEGDAKLRPLLEIKPSLRLGEGEYAIPVSGLRTMGHYYAHPDAAPVWNNHTGRGLRGNPLFDAIIAPGQAAAQLMLSVSGFHATTIATEAAFSEMALGLESVVNPGGGIMRAAKAVSRSGPVAVTGLVKALSIKDEYLKPGTHPEMTPVVKAMVKGGYRFARESEFMAGDRVKRLKAAWEDAVRGESAVAKAWGAARLPADVVMAAVETAANPVMGKFVPLQKMYATYMKIADAMNKEPKGEPGKPVNVDTEWAQNKEYSDIVNEMDFRFGQVVYDNHFINRIAKDVAQFTFLAPGWTFGTLALAARGIKDIARMPVDAVRGKRPTLGKSGAYWIGAFAGTAMINGIMTYFLTGQQPTGKDYLAYRDGTKDQDGNDNRHVLPGYIMKDLYGWSHHPVKTGTNKLSPGLHWAYAVLSNKDYWNNLVYDPNADMATISKQIAAFTGESVTPLSVRNFEESKRRNESGPLAMASNVMGITPAGKEFQRTPAQNLMTQFLGRRQPGGATPDEVDARQARADATRQLRGGDRTGVRDLVASGGMTVRQAKRSVLSLTQTPLAERFKRLTYDEAKQVLEQANPMERRTWQPLFAKKKMNALRAGRRLTAAETP